MHSSVVRHEVGCSVHERVGNGCWWVLGDGQGEWALGVKTGRWIVHGVAFGGTTREIHKLREHCTQFTTSEKKLVT
jgi:hypothetical protein